MTYLLEFTREVTTRDGYSVEIEAESPILAAEMAERMASDMDRSCPDEACEIGPTECHSWTVSNVTVVNTPTGATETLPVPANDTSSFEPNSTLSLPKDVWEGMLRAAQIGAPSLGVEDRAAVAAFTALKLHVHLQDTKLANAG